VHFQSKGLAAVSCAPSAKAGRDQQGAIAPIEFEEPIALPDGRELITLHDAPRSSPSCRSASTTRRNGSGHRGAHAGGQHGGPAMMAQIGVMRALFRDEKPVPTRREKPAKKYRIA
jgi:hypothetical protein